MAFDLQGEFSTVSNAISTGTFDPQGINFTTFFSPPSIPSPNQSSTGYITSNRGSISGSTINIGAPNNSQGSQPFANIGGSTITVPGASAVPSTSNNTQSTGQSPPITAGSLGDYFARAILVVLGFIFVAVGLNMLRGQPALQIPFAHK